MTTDQVVDLAVAALVLVVEISLPAVLAAMAVGLLVSIFQAATQIQEQTLTTVPKILAVVIVLSLCGGWLVSRVAAFTGDLFGRIAHLGG